MNIILTGGGTGGHVNPAIAIASKFPSAKIYFIGSDKGIENDLVPRAGYKLFTLDISGFRRSITPKDISYNISTLKKIYIANKKVKNILKEINPDIVIGTGGYASFPAVKVATKMGIKTAILEVNALAGITTKTLAKKVDKVFIAFEETRKSTVDTAILTGAPIKPDIIFCDRASARHELGVKENEKLVISFWGSLGAKYMNEAIIDFMIRNSKEQAFKHIHACGKQSYKTLIEKTKNLNIKSNIYEYFYDMPKMLAAADLVICRGGAGTLAEISAMSKASIIVPSPYVAENHQEKNARTFEKKGAAIVVLEKDANKLFDMASLILNDDNKRLKMEKASYSLAKLDALDIIQKEILALLQ